MLSIDVRTFQRRLKHFRELDSPIYHKPKRIRTSLKGETITKDLTDYGKEVGDLLPVGGIVKLPSYYKKQVYEKLYPNKEISLSHFNYVWLKKLQYIKNLKCTRFATCRKCGIYNAKLKKLEDEEQKQYIRGLKKQHIQMTLVERKHYHNIRTLGVENSSQVLTMIVDGMDQSKTIIPHTSKPTKLLENKNRLQTFITGILVHNQMPYSMAYISPPSIAHDSNCVLTCIIKGLIQVQKHYLLEAISEAKQSYESDGTILYDSRNNTDQGKRFISLSQILSQKSIPVTDNSQIESKSNNNEVGSNEIGSNEVGNNEESDNEEDNNEEEDEQVQDDYILQNKRDEEEYNKFSENSRKLISDVKRKGLLPPILYIQMDNCARENKNQYVLGVLGYLLHLKIFEHVYISFLPVGHTHEDVDQMFSCFSRYLKTHDAITPRELAKVIKDSYTYKQTKLNPIVEWIHEVAALKEWISPYVSTKKIKLSKYLGIWINLNSLGQVQLKYKYKNADHWWLPLDHGVVIMKHFPTKLPCMAPNRLFDQDGLINCIQSLRKDDVGFLNQQDFDEWLGFIGLMQSKKPQCSQCLNLVENLSENQVNNKMPSPERKSKSRRSGTIRSNIYTHLNPEIEDFNSQHTKCRLLNLLYENNFSETKLDLNSIPSSPLSHNSSQQSFYGYSLPQSPLSPLSSSQSSQSSSQSSSPGFPLSPWSSSQSSLSESSSSYCSLLDLWSPHTSLSVDEVCSPLLLPVVPIEQNNLFLIGGSPFNHVHYQRSMICRDVVVLLSTKYNMNHPFHVGLLHSLNLDIDEIRFRWYRRDILSDKYTLTNNIDLYRIKEVKIQVFGSHRQMFNSTSQLKKHIIDRLNQVVQGL